MGIKSNWTGYNGTDFNRLFAGHTTYYMNTVPFSWIAFIVLIESE